MRHKIGPLLADAFKHRRISPATAEKLRIYSGRRDKGASVLPDERGNVACFPYIEDGVVVAEKYRGPDKTFWQRPGGRRTFYNADAFHLAMKTGVDEVDQREPPSPLVITEGEIDCVSVIEAGWDAVVSVPDGAPSVASNNVQEEQTGKFEFLYNNRDRLKRVHRFILAVDNDAPGQVLAAELVRRLSSSRCSFVTYPDGCKDLNDVLMQFGPVEVMRILRAAQPYPVRGLYRLSDYPDLPATVTYATGWSTLDYHLKLFPGELMVVTGIPGHGKSSWVLNLAANCADLHRWRTAIFSPEMPVVPHLRDKLRAIRTQRAAWNDADRSFADTWIEDYFLFLDSDPGGAWESDEDKTLDWIMDKASEAVLRDGIRMLIIDPWNEVEHSRRRGETTTDYIGRGIRELRRFAQEREVVVVIVAHPTKEIRLEARAPGLYDIDGSANWANKPDHGVTIFRPENSDASLRSELFVTKVRFAATGRRGRVYLRFDQNSERFEMLDPIIIAEIEAEQAKKAKKTTKRKDNVVPIRPDTPLPDDIDDLK